VHEFGLVSGILDAVNQAAQEAHATAVLDIDLKIGEMTEAVEEALQFAFEVLRADTLCAEAVLHVEMVAPRSRCLECGREFDHDRYHLACPICGSFATELLAGKELTITSVEVDIPDDEQSDEPGR
jgi:hydrogenase nickel incorporation protein HypA/HybF